MDGNDGESSSSSSSAAGAGATAAAGAKPSPTGGSSPPKALPLLPPPSEVLPEPSGGPPSDVCRIQLRLPNGQRLVRTLRRSDPVASIYYIVSGLLQKPHSVATIYSKAVSRLLPGQLPPQGSGVSCDDFAAAGGVLGVGTVLAEADVSNGSGSSSSGSGNGTPVVGGRRLTGLALQGPALFRPPSWVDGWDLQKPHPAVSLIGDAGRSVAEAGLANSQIIVALLEAPPPS